jgi:hypothetical protein
MIDDRFEALVRHARAAQMSAAAGHVHLAAVDLALAIQTAAGLLASITERAVRR